MKNGKLIDLFIVAIALAGIATLFFLGRSNRNVSVLPKVDAWRSTLCARPVDVSKETFVAELAWQVAVLTDATKVRVGDFECEVPPRELWREGVPPFVKINGRTIGIADIKADREWAQYWERLASDE